MNSPKRGFVNYLQEFSIPLIAGVIAALLAANLAPDWYQHWFGAGHGEGPEVWELPGHLMVFGHHLNLHFFINSVFMVFFFGIATKEITEACLPGGSLNPPRKAVNPLIATLGGVVGPVAVFFLAMNFIGPEGFNAKPSEWNEYLRGWGIPTATDIALAWLVARAVFGSGHPAINFLLLLAIADDAIGLGIIAVFYGDPEVPNRPEFLGLVAAGMALAYVLRRRSVRAWWPYIFLAGGLSWCGLMMAHLHAALALVPIVPFLPAPSRDVGLFSSGDEVDKMGEKTAEDLGLQHSTLENYEHQTKLFVDFGLFFFAMGNAGVEFSSVGLMTWVIFASLLVGKTVGIVAFGLFGKILGFPLPTGMVFKDLFLAGLIAGLGLTVALFVAGAAYGKTQIVGIDLGGQAKMGALLSGGIGFLAIVAGRLLKAKRPPEGDS
ncbi:MAG TPA: sodium:proton antiporter [Planctomycetes bacterium]|nr:sodium:proton antiporter [Planctomycetota bacterium]HIL37681.1 sodium:proton antiporter [Planctomycetota bacterium]